MLKCKKIWYYYRRITEYFELRLEVIYEVSKDAAQVLLAVLVAEFFTKNELNIHLVLWALVLTITFLISAITSHRIK
jgi:hypothetical protein